MFGIFLILIGVVWLLSSMGIIMASVGQIIWPIVLIAIGISVLIRPRHGRYRTWQSHSHKQCHCTEENKDEQKGNK